MSDEVILDRYRLLSSLGAGGYGSVSVAWDTRIQRRVAIKAMPVEQATEQSSADLDDDMPEGHAGAAPYALMGIPGLEEARTAAMLSDPAIVGVLDFEVQGSTAYLIMEYVDGISLKKLLADHPSLVSIDVIAHVFRALSHALCVAHENRVLHLDIKPDNVLIDRKGNVKVTDFGLAELSSASGYSQAVGGTIGYMPPEQMDRLPLDERCDEWALAALTYEMIAGANPFLAKDLDAARSAIANAELVLPSLCLDGLDEQVDDVLFYALDPDRGERYETVADFAEELQPFLGSAAAGRRQLARIVAADCSDMPEEAPVEHQPVEMEPPAYRDRQGGVRIWSALNCAALGFVALSNMTWSQGHQSLLFWGLFAVLVVLGALAPSVGALVATACMGAALLSLGAYVPGALVIGAAVVWWLNIGRKGAMQAACALSPVILGAFGLGAVMPVLNGRFLDKDQALPNTLFGIGLSLVLAGLGSYSLSDWMPLDYWQGMTWHFGTDLMPLVASASLWIDVVAWLVAAWVFALCCHQDNRFVGLAGALAVGVIGLCALGIQLLVSNGLPFSLPSAERIVWHLIPAAVAAVSVFVGRRSI